MLSTPLGTQCACEVGVDVAMESLSASERLDYIQNNVGQVLTASSTGGSRRFLLETVTSGLSGAYPDGFSGFRVLGNSSDLGKLERQAAASAEVEVSTPCASHSDCIGTYGNRYGVGVTMCSSPFGDGALPCASCPARSPLSRGDGPGFQCSARTRRCECTAPVSVKNPFAGASSPNSARHTLAAALESQKGMWRGNSFCDKVLRGLEEKSDLSAVEMAHAERCMELREMAHAVRRVAGIPTLPSDIFYNPLRGFDVLTQLGVAVGIYFENGFDGTTAERLYKAHADPFLWMPMIEHMDTLASAFSWKNIRNATVDVLGEQAVEKMEDFASNSADFARYFPRVTLPSNSRTSALRAWNATAHVVGRLGGSGATKLGSGGEAPVGVPPSRRLLLQVLSGEEAPVDRDGEVDNGLSCPPINRAVTEAREVLEGLANYYGEGGPFESTICKFTRFAKGRDGELQNERCGGVPSSTGALNSRQGPDKTKFDRAGGNGTASSAKRDLVQKLRVSRRAVFQRNVMDTTVFPALKMAFPSLGDNNSSAFTLGTVDSAIDDLLDYVTEDPSKGSEDTSSRSQRFFKCDYTNALACKRGRRSEADGLDIMDTAIEVGIFMAGIGFGMFALFGAYGGVFSGALLATAYPFAVAYLQYEYSPACFFSSSNTVLGGIPILLPALPTCLFDDLFAVASERIFQPRIQWGQGLVPNATRAPLVGAGGFDGVPVLDPAGIVDCTDEPFYLGNPINHLFYTLERIFPEWRATLKPVYMMTQETDFLRDAANLYEGSPVTEASYTQCAAILLPNLLLSLMVVFGATVLTVALTYSLALGAARAMICILAVTKLAENI